MTDPEVQKALLFISHLSAEGLSEFSEVNIGNPGHIVAYTRDGIAVRLGDGSQMEEQLAWRKTWSVMYGRELPRNILMPIRHLPISG